MGRQSKVNIGDKFNRWTVFAKGTISGNGHQKWLCKCDCGNDGEVFGSNLIRGISTSCSCQDIENLVQRSKTHGMTKTRIYKIWAGVRKRCLNPNMKSYEHYGGRGIKICKRWDEFENFYEDMKDGYDDDLTLERDNCDGDYEPGNCSWATPKQQARNKRNSVFIEHNGKKYTKAEWEEITGTGRCTIAWRLKNGWSVNEALYGKPETNINNVSKYLTF